MKKLFAIIFTFSVVSAAVFAQEPQPTPATQQPTAEEVEKKTAELSKNAYRLLDQVIDEAQNLRLTENRVHVQIVAADALWERNPDRARSLFAMAADGVAELQRNQDNSNNARQNFGGQGRRPAQVRQELLLTVARHDAQLAYQLLASTKPPVQSQPNNDQRNPRGGLGPINNEDNLEQNLLAQVASLDPKFAAQNADQMLEKGQFPRSLTEVIAQLQRQDKEAAAKLTDKTLKRLGSANLLSNNDASTLALGLLAPGPRVAPANTTGTTADTSKTQATAPVQYQVLDQSAYTDLMGTVVDFALKATPQPPQNNQRPGPNQRRGFGPNGAGFGQTNLPSQPTDAQIEQANARRLLTGLQNMLPQMDQYLPSRAQQVRQKMTEVGLAPNQRESFAQAMSALQSNANADALVQAAESAPPQFQPRLYQQAALKALDEGNSDRARQIATDHLQNTQRDAVLQKVDFKEMAKKAEGTRLDEIKQNLARMRSDNERVDALLQMAGDVQTSNPKLSRQLLEEARQMTNKRAASYDQFAQQLKVAHAFATIEPARSFEVLDPGISQLNELISAAALLNGFEVNMFRDGELPLQSGNGLTSTVSQYGEELAALAKTDFARSESLAGRFQLPEARTLARLAIIEELLGSQPAPQANQNPFRAVFGGQNFNVIRQN
jgi:hypothetical protein